MTTIQILEQYGLNFANVIFPNDPNKLMNKSFTGGGFMEDFFGYTFNYVELLDEDVIPVINHFIAGNVSQMDDQLHISTGGFVIFDTELSAVIFYNYDISLDYIESVPFEDFKTIAEAWRNFLLTPPLNGVSSSGLSS